MRNVLFILAIAMFIFSSCGKETIDEHAVCYSKSDCKAAHECKFDASLEKDYGKCVEIKECTSDDVCEANLICMASKECGPATLSITSSTLDSANLGSEYSAQLAYEGTKEGHFHFAEVDALPAGLSLSETGLITGTPTEVGSFTFKVKLFAHAKEGGVYYGTEFVEASLTLEVIGGPCLPNPCVETNKTTCTEDQNAENGYVCSCDEGHLLIDDACLPDVCNHPENPCTDLNKTICTPNEDRTGYTCSCDDGFALVGEICLLDICNTPSNPCVETNKTTCTPNEDNTAYTCSCDEGYYSDEAGDCFEDKCSADVNPCTEENRTQCVNDSTNAQGFVCGCDDGYSEIDGNCILDSCATNPCTDSIKNVCVVDTSAEGNYRCECKANFYEDEAGNCQFDYCEFQKPCDANVDTYKTKCINDQSSPTFYTCACDDLYDTNEAGDCYFNPCKVNRCREPYKSICTPTGEGQEDYECSCDEGYTVTEDGQCYPNGDLCATAIEALPDTEYTGSTKFSHADYVSTCGSYARSKENVYTITLTENKLVTATLTSNPLDPYHPVLYVRDGCEDTSSQFACVDRDGDNTDVAKIEKLYLEAGSYFVYADGHGENNVGEYTFQYTLEEPCYQDTDCSNDNTTFCDLETHTCKENKCLTSETTCTHGECDRLDATCACDEGYINSDEFTCVADPCYNTVCTENSTCVVQPDFTNYVCECDENFVKTNSGTCLQNPCAPENSCTETNRTKCSYTIGETALDLICECDDNYFDENGVCKTTIADTCPGVYLPAGVTFTGDTRTLNPDYKYSTASSYGSGSGNEAVYRFTLTKRARVKIEMSYVGTNWDRYLYIRKDSCTSTQVNDAWKSDKTGTSPEVVEDDLEPGEYYIFADGYSSSSKGEYSILLTIDYLCQTNAECAGENQVCGSSGACECAEGLAFGSDAECHEPCLVIEDNYYCTNSLFECNTDEVLCYKRTACEPECGEHASCNLENLTCVCDAGYTQNEEGACVPDLCVTNNVTCTGSHVNCMPLTGACVCDEGYENYTEALGCVIDENPCTPNPCVLENKTTCQATGLNDGDFTCACDDGFVENADGLCVDDACQPNPCGDNSICTLDAELRSICSCAPGFERNENTNTCEEISGNSCVTPFTIETGSHGAIMTTSWSKSATLSCETNELQYDQVYALNLETQTTLSVALTGASFPYVLGLTSNCSETPTEVACAESIENVSLEAGLYYIYVKANGEGAFNLNVTATESMYLKKTSLTDAVLERAYDEAIEVGGGEEPYQIEMIDTLPEGLSLTNGRITGTPTVATADGAMFKVKVTDANMVIQEFDLGLTVVDNTEALLPKSGDLLVNEIHYKAIDDVNQDGISNPYQDEFVEIVNTSYKDLNLDGLSLWDSLDFSYRHNFTGTLPAGHAIVIFGGGDLSALSAEHVTFVKASSGTLSLKNTGDSVRLVSALGDLLENITYTNNNVDASINRNPDLTNTSFVPHTYLGMSAYSPGTKVDGSSF